MTDRRRCEATTAAGRPCRAWAVRDTEPPRCSAHAGRTTGAGAPDGNQNARTHGFYARTLTPAELADLVAATDLTTLEDEIAVTRVALRRLLHLLHDEGASPEDILKVAPLVFKGTGRIARLLRDQRIISGAIVDDSLGAIAGALDLVSDELGVDL